MRREEGREGGNMEKKKSCLPKKEPKGEKRKGRVCDGEERRASLYEEKIKPE